MRAAWVGATEVPAGPDDLRSEGIAFEVFEPATIDATSERFAQALGLPQRTQVTRAGGNPRDDAALAKEGDEHAHVADEVRLVAEGVVVYDVLSHDGARWLRLWLGAGDAIVIPAKRYHRLLAPPMSTLRFVEIYGEPAGMMPLYRASDDATRAV
jgi:1,2-dihydroxy-3-keto-5-methylthiopentene dioxygenase